MAEYSRMAKGYWTVVGGTLGVSAPNVHIQNLPFKPDYVELINYTQAATPAQHGIPFAFWDASVPPLTFSSINYDTVVEIFNATPVLTTDMVKVGGGISVFSGGLSFQYGPTQQIASTTIATNTITTASAHGYAVGDTVIMQGLATGVTNNALRLINGVPFTIVTVPSTTTFTIEWNLNQSNYANVTGSPVGALVKKVLFPFLYLPEDNVISAITLGNTTTIQTTMYSDYEVGQEVAFRIPALFGTTQLNSLPNNIVPGSPIYGYVVSITDNYTFVVNINSSAYTAFNNNPAVVPTNFTLPQVVGVGDVNTGGLSINSTSPLYPSPQFPISTNRVPTINGPAIKGAFVNNTSQGFIVGNFNSRTDTTSWVGGSNGDIIEWRAYLHDYSSP
jgi:hypothetical protein